MDDPSRFTSINEYYTFIYAISYMMLVELGIWIYNFKGWLKKPDKKNNDYGTILIVMLGCWGSFYFSTYFRNQQFIQIAGEILLPHIFYYVGMRLRGFVSRRRFLLSALRDKVSRGTEQLPRVPLPAEPRFGHSFTQHRNGGL